MDDDRDWSWLDQPLPTIVTPPAEMRLWVLAKDARRAELLVRPHPFGQELRCSVNGALLWSEVFQPGDGRRLGAVADEHRTAWEARGWQPVDQDALWPEERHSAAQPVGFTN